MAVVLTVGLMGCEEDSKEIKNNEVAFTVAANAPASVAPLSKTTVPVTVTGAPGVTLSWTVTAGVGGGTFDPDSASLTLDGAGKGSFDLSYEAPFLEGTYTHDVTATTSEGASASAAISLPVVAGTAGGTGAALFIDPSFVEYSPGNSGAEASNMESSLVSLGYAVATFAGTTSSAFSTAVMGKAALIIPETEIGDLNLALSAAAKTAIADFVSTGGVLILVNDGFYMAGLLNAIFGLGVLDGTFCYSGFEVMAMSATASAGTPFVYGPASVSGLSCTNALLTSSLPVGAQAIYRDALGDSIVTLIPYGMGHIVVLSWDWFDALPTGLQDGGWLELLDLVMFVAQNDAL